MSGEISRRPSCRASGDGTSEDDEPLVQSCVQETALDSVRVDLTVSDTDEETAAAREEDDAVRWSVGQGRSPPPTVPASSAAVRALHAGRVASLSEVEEQPDAHCERETMKVAGGNAQPSEEDCVWFGTNDGLVPAAAHCTGKFEQLKSWSKSWSSAHGRSMHRARAKVVSLECAVDVDCSRARSVHSSVGVVVRDHS